jgi:hypothetical protein
MSHRPSSRKVLDAQAKVIAKEDARYVAAGHAHVASLFAGDVNSAAVWAPASPVCRFVAKLSGQKWKTTQAAGMLIVTVHADGC